MDNLGNDLKVFIITEGGGDLGFGHINRCSSIFDAFLERNISPYFIINGDQSIRSLMNTQKYTLFDWLKESDKLLNIVKNSDICIIDSYLIDRLLCIKLSQVVKIPVFIDDNNRIEYPSGLVINSSIHANKLRYPKHNDISYLLGTNYSMLKKEFWEINTKNVNEEIKTMMITFGSNDLRSLTPQIINIIKNQFINVKVKVVIGKNFKNIDEIGNYKDERCELIYSPDSEGMKEIMLESDIAITAGGQTVYELASLGVPCITIAIADNQQNSVETCAELGINFYAGWWSNADLFDNIINYIIQLKEQSIRANMVKNGRNYIKADGSRNIIKYLMSKYYNSN